EVLGPEFLGHLALVTLEVFDKLLERRDAHTLTACVDILHIVEEHRERCRVISGVVHGEDEIPLVRFLNDRKLSKGAADRWHRLGIEELVERSCVAPGEWFLD